MSGLIDLTDAWIEWYEKCALDLCSDEHIRQLCRCSNSIYHKIVGDRPFLEPYVYVPKEKEKIHPLDDKEREIKNELIWNPAFLQTFHIMERECIPLIKVVTVNDRGEEVTVFKEKEERQQFKKRVFDNAGEPGKVTRYLLEITFRNYARKRTNQSTQTLVKPAGTGEEDWLEWLRRENGKSADPKKQRSRHSDPEDEFESEVMVSLNKETIWKARQMASVFWSGLPEKDRAAFYVFAHRIPTTCKALQDKVGLNHSALSGKPQKMLERVKCRLDEQKVFEEDQIVILGAFLSFLHSCYREWETTSELGKWISSHFIDDGHKKMRYVPDGTGQQES